MSLLAYLFVIVAVAMRLLPHPFNFTPIAASLLFFGARVDRKYMWIPLALLVGADCYLTVFHYRLEFSWTYLVESLAWYSAIILLGSLLRKSENVARIAGASVAASISFFFMSNAVSPWVIPDMYPKNLHGIALSIAAGVPFFRSTLVSDLFFTAVAFGTPYVISAVERMLTSHDNIAAA